MFYARCPAIIEVGAAISNASQDDLDDVDRHEAPINGLRRPARHICGDGPLSLNADANRVGKDDNAHEPVELWPAHEPFAQTAAIAVDV